MKTSLNLLFLFVFVSNSLAQDMQPSDYSFAQLDSLLEVFKKEKAQDKILSYAQVGADKAAEKYGKEDTTYAKMLYYLGFGYRMKQDFKNAEKYYLQAIAIQKIKIPKSPDYAASLNVLGALYFNKRNNALAEPLYKEAMNIRKAVLGDKHPDYASSLNNLAGLYKNMDNNAVAEPLYKEAIRIKKEVLGEKHPDYAVSLNNLAVLYKDLGSYALAEPLYKEALSIRKEALGDKHPDYANSLNSLANLYTTMGNGVLAEPLHKEAMSIRKEALGDKHPEYASSLNNLAVLYKNLRNYEKAEPLYKESIKIKKEVLGDKDLEYAGSLNNLASLYAAMNNYALAEPLYKESIKIKKEVLGDKHPDYANGLNNLADLYWNMENHVESWNCIQQAITACSGQNSSIHISETWADSLRLCDFSTTETIENSLVIAYKLLKSNSDTSNSQASLGASTQASLGTSPQASLGASQIILTDLALHLLQKSRNDFSEDGDKLRTLAQTSDWVLRGLDVLSKNPNLLSGDKNTQAEKAFAFAEQSKSVLLLEAAHETQAQSFSNLPDSLVQKEHSLQKQKANYQASITEKRPESERDSLRALLNKLNFEIQDFKATIEKSYPNYVALKYKSKTAEAKEIQALLDDKTALLEYVIGDSVVYVFYIAKNTINLYPIYVSNNLLASKIKGLHQILSNYKLAIEETAISYRKYTENAHWFYKNLVEPALQNAKGISKLIIVSDGELGFLPFESFLVKPAPQVFKDYASLHYLINDYKISYNYSATLWQSSKKATSTGSGQATKANNNGQLLAMAANYEIKIDPTKTDWRLPIHQRMRVPLQPLPAAQKEVEVLSENFQGFFALDKDASEKIFKEKAGSYAVIHLAMHGLLDKEGPILSSLVFTEDGDSLENNFLHAYEISKMKLNADLVVLSACETGFGRFERGNGIASLAQAFAYAGAPALIVSLWQVSDYATSEIMKNLYQNLANGMEKDEALQQAKLQYMKNTKGVLGHPAFWSPFVLMGNTDAIYLKTKGGWFWWLVGGGVLVLGAGLLAVRSRKKE